MVLSLISLVVFVDIKPHVCLLTSRWICQAFCPCLSLVGAATSIIFVATRVCHDKTRLLSRQNTSFVTTKVCLLRQHFCRDKIMFIVTNMCLSRQK